MATNSLLKVKIDVTNPSFNTHTHTQTDMHIHVPEVLDNESNQELSWLHHSLEGASAHTPTNDPTWLPPWPILKLPPFVDHDKNLFNPHNGRFPSSPSPPSPPSPPSSNGASMDDEGEGWGPVYGEDEDLRRAIEMSLAEHHEGEADSGGVCVCVCMV